MHFHLSTLLYYIALQSKHGTYGQMSIFIIIGFVYNAFSIGRRDGKSELFWKRCCMVRSESIPSSVGLYFFISDAVRPGFLGIYRHRNLSVVSEVFLERPDFVLWAGTIFAERPRDASWTRLINLEDPPVLAIQYYILFCASRREYVHFSHLKNTCSSYLANGSNFTWKIRITSKKTENQWPIHA